MPGKIGNQSARRHGHSSRDGTYARSLTYNTWRTMKERCLYDRHKWFHLYGGKGVTICSRWLGKEGFKNFLADMGPRPHKGMTLHRKDSLGNYEKHNCVWASKFDQNAALPRREDGTYGYQQAA